MNDGNSITPFGDLSKPANTLVEKVSDAVGGIFRPWQIKRLAKAEAEAHLITAEGELTVTDLNRRAMHRFVEEEAKKQHNMESIISKAIPLLNENSKPENVSDDFYTNFFDKSRIVSDEDMQELWARVLAGEANTPGVYFKKTVNLLGDLDKEDAELFIRLCGFVWIIGKADPIILNVIVDPYRQHGINFDTLSHLETLGLVQFNNINPFSKVKLHKYVPVLYYDKSVTLTFPKETGNEIDIGSVMFTRAGRQLFPMCGSKPVEGFFEFVYDKWTEMSLVPKRKI